MIEDGDIIEGALFSEPMRVEGPPRENGPDAWSVALVGTRTTRFRRVTLTKTEIDSLTVTKPSLSFQGDGALLKLGVQAYSLGVAYEFDPYFGLSISRVDPLPHQLEAIYEHMLRLARVRFLLADDAGAGKTIMAGLLMRELKLRGLVQRVLILCPANLTFQWQRELFEKFGEKFVRLKGSAIRDQFGVNQWMENPQVVTSLDLAKRSEILPGLRQCHWDLVVVDEAHRMSAYSSDKKSLRYKLGEDLSDRCDHLLLLTATPHKGDPANFSLFLQLLDRDAYADVRSIREAMERRRAPFYLRRTKEAMVYFPERLPDGSWEARKIFTRRIAQTADFHIDGEEFQLYRDVSRFVKRQCQRAAEMGHDARARAVGFLMSLYQRRLASSAYALRRSLRNRARRLRDSLKKARELAREAPPILPSPEEIEEMEDEDREHLERVLEAITLSENPELVHEEIARLEPLAQQAEAVEQSGTEAKLARLRKILEEEGFFAHPDRRLLIFTEFRDTLAYLAGDRRAGLPGKLVEWGFRVGVIHGGMKPGSRDEPATRLYAEQQFREGAIQILVATEAAGEGINLQCCHVLFNYDIPWNPMRLEQRMGRIHRYGQTMDCLIFNFVATNTVEGRVLNKLLRKLQEIRDALDDDAVFNVVGDVLPAAQIERVLRDYYAGKLGAEDFEERVLRDLSEDRFRSICQHALEGLASKKLNLEMLVERRARAQEHRIVPETVARFLRETAPLAKLPLREVASLPHTFDPGRTPRPLRRYETDETWKSPALAARYPRLSTDRKVAEEHNLEWVTPGHSLFEALRRHTCEQARESLAQGASFYALDCTHPTRLDIYRAQVVDGLGNVAHERLFVVQLAQDAEPVLRRVGTLVNLVPTAPPDPLPAVASAPEPLGWLHEHALRDFLDEVRQERLAEVERIAEHIELSLTELIAREDEKIGRLGEDVSRGVEGAAGNLKQAEMRQAELLARRQRRREELQRQQALTLQSIERLTSVLVLPHPSADEPEVRRLRPNEETEMTAMRVVMEHERAQGRVVEDVHEQDLGYDVTSLDTQTGDLRLIEVKGIGGPTGTICLTPNEKRVAEDRPDCYWLYVVTHCATAPRLQEPIPNPARYPWHEVTKVDHYYLSVNAVTGRMQVHEDTSSYGERGDSE